MVGADLANVVNQAALAAARRGAQIVEQRDFEAALDRFQLGLEKKGRVMTDEEKRRVAYHEGVDELRDRGGRGAPEWAHSERTAQLIDDEVRALLEREETRAKCCCTPAAMKAEGEPARAAR